MRGIFFFLLNFYVLVGLAQTNHFEKGKILNSLPVQNSSETYAVYLPTSFDETKLSAVVFIFDPSAYGANGMKTFITSAEKFNYILIASNNTKNGVAYETNFAITNRLFATVFSTFKIDEKQIYAAGFSGGSRLATAIAALTEKIQGVVACGAGLAINKSFTPKKEMFSFVGLVGDEDMNYQEMFNTKALLDKFNVDNELFVYNDTHRWPPSEQIERAFGWLEIQAYKKNIKSVDSQFVQSFFETQYAIADSLVIHNKFRSVQEYESIIKNFASYFELKATQQKLDGIKKSPEYKSQVEQRATYIKEENELYEKFSKVYSNDILAAKSDDNFQWWRKELRRLNIDIENAKATPRGKMLKRLKYSIFAGAYESSMGYIYAEKYQHALYCDQLLVYFNPEQAYWYFRVAQSYARNDDFKHTIRNLKKAKELGLQRFQAIQQSPLFAKFKQKKKFKKLFEEESK
ncbi:acetylxylan esterase [uncultured Kordia sp.]|uniref:acetylxylan esterase n=1 Tax=uncultured Kordia sp. TaxID=507699 RepID=UPI00261C1237|nr:acetylxylan esterase [uncultured Kordia sp.]